MTKKDSIAIARIISGCYQDSPGAERRLGIGDVAYGLAQYFKAINPNFNRQRFMDACGLNRETPAGTAELD